MACSRDGFPLLDWAPLDRGFLYQPDQLSNPRHPCLEYGGRFRLYRGWFHARNPLAIITRL